MRVAFLLIIVTVVACGEAPTGEPLTLSFNTEAAQTSAPFQCQDSSNHANARALLFVSGGFPACELTVGANLSASGSCDMSLPTKTVRYVLAAFLTEDPVTQQDVPLLFLVDTLDLTEAGLAAMSTREGRAEKRFSGPSIIDPVDLSALAGAPADDSPLERARAWAKEVIDVRDWNLDRDGDSCPNLAESCTGELFVATAAACP